jgi:hypothetical protein
MSYEIIKADIYRDRQAITEFWNRNNEKKIDKKFDWFYLSNPDGPASTFLINHQETSQCVGMASVFPRQFVYQNESFTAGINGDFFIQREHRSFGPALMLIRAILEHLEKSDTDFLLTFPNRKAEPIFRRAGYRRLGGINKYVRLFDLQRLLSVKADIPEKVSRIISPLANLLVNLTYPDSWTFNYGRFDTCTSRTLDFDIDELVEQYHSSWLAPLKSKQYLQWKYELDPDDDNLFFLLKEKSNRVVGLIVFCLEPKNIVQIREIVHTDDEYTLLTLIGSFFRHIKKANCEYAYAYMYENSGILRSSNNLDLTPYNRGRTIFYAVNPQRENSERITRLIHSTKLCLTKNDEDS